MNGNSNNSFNRIRGGGRGRGRGRKPQYNKYESEVVERYSSDRYDPRYPSLSQNAQREEAKRHRTTTPPTTEASNNGPLVTAINVLQQQPNEWSNETAESTQGARGLATLQHFLKNFQPDDLPSDPIIPPGDLVVPPIVTPIADTDSGSMLEDLVLAAGTPSEVGDMEANRKRKRESGENHNHKEEVTTNKKLLDDFECLLVEAEGLGEPKKTQEA